jgi:hypothetical protein
MDPEGDRQLRESTVDGRVIRNQFHATEARSEAIVAAMITVGLPGGLVVLLAAVAGIALNYPPDNIVVAMIYALTVVGMTTAVAGYMIGWFAHYWFRETKTSTKKLATIIALIFDISALGWLVVLIWSTPK